MSLVGASVAALVLLAGLAAAPAAGPALETTPRGELVCSSCWLKADRKTVPYGGQAGFVCAQRCAQDGVGPGLAGREGKQVTLYLLEGSVAAWALRTGRL